MSVEIKTTLIVNYLPQSLTDDEFTQMFTDVAPVLSCKIIRDRNTGYSFGFGFVEYSEESQAAAAIEKLNGKKIQNKTIKVAYSRSGENVKGANLHITNLPKSCTQNDLTAMFEEYGKVVHCRILSDQMTGESKGIGFVLFDTRDQAETALKALNGKKLPGFNKPLSINFAEDRGRTNQTNFVPDIGAAASSSAGMATPYGMLGGAGMFGGAGMASPFGEFAAAAAAYFMQYAGMYNEGMYGMPRMPGRGLYGMGMEAGMMGGGGGVGAMRGGRMMRGGKAGTRFNPMSAGSAGPSAAPASKGLPTAPGGHVLFAYNIGSATTENDLRTLFSLYGTVTKVDVIQDFAKNMGKGYGFVTMPDYDEAAFAISQLNGYNYAGKPLQVSFKSKKD